MKQAPSFVQPTSISPSSSFYNTSPSLSPSSCNRHQTKLSMSTATVSVRTLKNESDLIRRLKESSANEAVTVVKCKASYCAGCRGAAPKYNKLAAAYDGELGDRIAFYDLDYPANEEFCKEALGVANLPFFAVFKGNNLMSAEPIGWRSLSTTLVDNIEHAIHG